MSRKAAFLRLRCAGILFDMFYLIFSARVLESQEYYIINHTEKECEPQWLVLLPACDSVLLYSCALRVYKVFLFILLNVCKI